MPAHTLAAVGRAAAGKVGAEGGEEAAVGAKQTGWSGLPEAARAAACSRYGECGRRVCWPYTSRHNGLKPVAAECAAA